MLRGIELEVLSVVERGDTISELATNLDHSESYLSRAVVDLVEKGLVYTERDGRQKRVVPSDARAVALYQDFNVQRDVHPTHRRRSSELSRRDGGCGRQDRPSSFN